MTVLEIVGVVALVMIGLFVVTAVAAGVYEWWQNREYRRWPDSQEWRALEIVTCGHFPSEGDKKRAKVAYRKLRYKYGKRT